MGFVNRHLFGFLWRRHRLSASTCALAPCVLGVLVGLIYPTLSGQREAAKSLLKIGQRFFGGSQHLDLFSALGAFTMPFQHPVALILFAVIGAIPATALPAGERGRGGLDLLLATPLERRSLVATVGCFQSLRGFMIGMGAYAGALLGAGLAGEWVHIPVGQFLVLMLNAAALSFCWGSVALVVSVHASDRSTAMRSTFILVFGFFLVDIASRLWREGRWLGNLTPYGFLRPADSVGPMGDAGLAWRNIVILLTTSLALQIWAAKAEVTRATA